MKSQKKKFHIIKEKEKNPEKLYKMLKSLLLKKAFCRKFCENRNKYRGDPISITFRSQFLKVMLIAYKYRLPSKSPIFPSGAYNPYNIRGGAYRL